MSISFSPGIPEIFFFFLPPAEVLYHCAAQVHWRSMTQPLHCSNVFHLGANEMHLAVNLQIRGQAVTVPAIYLSATFRRKKWHMPSHRMQQTRVQAPSSVSRDPM